MLSAKIKPLVGYYLFSNFMYIDLIPYLIVSNKLGF